MAISRARAEAICSAGEFELVKASVRREISQLSAAELRRSESRARKLRDKWRDQSAGQRRAVQAKAGGRVAAGDRNSADKAALFGEVLARYSAQLAKVEAAGETPGPMGRKRSTRTARSRTHRASRAEARGELAEAKRELKAKKKKPAPVTPIAPAAAKRKKKAAPRIGLADVAIHDEMERGLDEPPATVKMPSRSGKPFAASMSAVEAGRKAQGLRVTKQQQLRATTAAKQDRLRAGGMIRIQKNRSAANKRQQGRRDSR